MLLLWNGIPFLMTSVWRLGQNILERTPPTVSLLWVRDREEERKNNTLPSTQYSISAGNTPLHWNKVGSNFRFTRTLTTEFVKIHYIKFCIGIYGSMKSLGTHGIFPFHKSLFIVRNNKKLFRWLNHTKIKGYFKNWSLGVLWGSKNGFSMVLLKKPCFWTFIFKSKWCCIEDQSQWANGAKNLAGNADTHESPKLRNLS